MNENKNNGNCDFNYNGYDDSTFQAHPVHTSDSQ